MGSLADFIKRISVWQLAAAFSALYLAAAWIHAWSDHLYGENEPAITFWGVLVVATPAKIGFLCCVPLMLRHVFLAVGQERRRGITLALAWMAAGAACMAPLVAFRDRFVEMLNNDVIRLYPVSDSSPALAKHFIGREEWLVRWQSGEILAIEAGFVVAFIGLILAFGWVWPNCGERKVGIPKVAATVFALVVFTISWPILSGLAVLDYDFFLGGIISDSLALDFAQPFAVGDPIAQLTAPLYLAFVVSTYLGLRLSARGETLAPHAACAQSSG